MASLEEENLMAMGNSTVLDQALKHERRLTQHRIVLHRQHSTKRERILVIAARRGRALRSPQEPVHGRVTQKLYGTARRPRDIPDLPPPGRKRQ